MNKIVQQAFLGIGFFFLLWFSLSQLDWMKIFHVEEVSISTEEKLGNLLWKSISEKDESIDDKLVFLPVDTILTKLCRANHIDRDDIKLHIIDRSEINAFAMPGGHLVIYSGLIDASSSEEELCGIIGHELAHIKLNHVMKNLIKEVGLSVLLSMTSGGGGDIAKEMAKQLTSTAYNRKLEKEADLKAVDYMVEADVDPEPFAEFMYALSTTDGDLENLMSWVSTHPASRARAEYIIEYSNDKEVNSQPMLGDATWDKLQEAID